MKILVKSMRTLVVAVTVITVLAACGQNADDVKPAATDEARVVEVCVDENAEVQMTYDEAVAIAESSVCIEHGSLAATRVCNGATGTWWIDLDVEDDDCNAACAVDIVSQTAEVNWRCTGALPEAEASTEAPIPTDVPTAAPDPAENWPRYASLRDGISFRYPPTWTIELLTEQDAPDGGDPLARGVLLSQEALRLRIAFKARDEAAIIGPETLPEGRTEQRGTILLFGRQVPRQVIFDGDTDLAIFAGDRFADLEVYVELIADDDVDGARHGVSESARADFDAILATLQRTDPEASQDAYPGWATYVSDDIAPGLGFSFRHRSDWTLTEVQPGTEAENGPAAALALLARDDHILRVQYKVTGDETVLLAPEVDEGLLIEAGTAWFMGRPAPRMVLVDDERLTHVLVSYSDDALLITVELSQNPDLVAKEVRELSAGIRAELDEILASFKLTTP